MSISAIKGSSTRPLYERSKYYDVDGQYRSAGADNDNIYTRVITTWWPRPPAALYPLRRTLIGYKVPVYFALKSVIGHFQVQLSRGISIFTVFSGATCRDAAAMRECKSSGQVGEAVSSFSDDHAAERLGLMYESLERVLSSLNKRLKKQQRLLNEL